MKSSKSDVNAELDTQEVSNQNVTFLTILQSVFASFIGIQNNENRKRDFESGKFWHFFLAGIIFVIVFLLMVWFAVQYLIATA
ncbi:MAG: DUF2970 domain-containing protein [Gammaproteobacteria bacterium]|nr:DUF2970 domain-containing protein [Gammaproteobacteria bacterium]NKB65322.1 DUF2970 domain-containing protein [Gammaproteobacteria bacterium]